MLYNYGEFPKEIFDNLSNQHKTLLKESKHFCILPWLHLFTQTNGNVYPCCYSDPQLPIGDSNKDTLIKIWNNENMRQLRKNMIDGKMSEHCKGCYEIEVSGFLSTRQSKNIKFANHINLIDNTGKDGSADFIIKYVDARFSNICNMACRSCGTWSSSQWYDVHKKLYGQEPNHPKILKVSDKIFETIMQNIEHIEEFYFAGGEPLIMEEHYRILKELDRRKMYHVRLVYNTNLSKLKFKNIDVCNIWKKFKDVRIGASLDAEGSRGEYMRKGTVWNEIVENRKKILKESPNVVFYISATVGLINAFHVIDFHKNWVEKQLITSQNFNINILLFPEWQRVDVLPTKLKKQLKEKYEKHLDWILTFKKNKGMAFR